MNKINYLQIFKLFFLIIFFKALISIFLPKIVVTGFLLILLFLVFFNLLFRLKMNVRNLLIFLLQCYLCINFIFSLFLNIEIIQIQYALISFFQFLFSLLLLQVFSELSIVTLSKLTKFVSKLTFIFIIIGFIEFCMPHDLMSKILVESNFLINGERGILVSYHFGDFTIEKYRLGSLFFEPLTFAFVSSAYFLWYLNQNKYINFKSLFSGFVHFFALGKMPILISIFSIVSFVVKKYSIIFFMLIFFSAFFLMFSIPEKVLLTKPSMGYHILGFRKGIENTKDYFFKGHGLGTAGYNVFLASKGKKNPFIYDSVHENGNESAIGVMVYQLGFIYTILYIGLLFNISLELYKKGDYLIFGLFTGYILSLFLLESSLSVIITSVIFLFCFSRLKEHERG